MKILKKILFIFLFMLLISYNFTLAVEKFPFTDRFGNQHSINEFNLEGYDLSNGYFIKYTDRFQLYLLGPNSSFSVTGNSMYLHQGTMYAFDETSSSWKLTLTSPYNSNPRYLGLYSECYYSTVNIYNYGDTSKIIYEAQPDIFNPVAEEEYIFPYIADTDEVLSNLDNIDYILILPGSLSKTYLPLKIGIYKYIDDYTSEHVFELSLDTSSPYYEYVTEYPDEYWWEIPTELFKNSLQNGQEYHFTLLGANEKNDFSILRSITYQGTTYVPPTDEEIQTDAIKDQTEKIEEQTDAIKDQTEKIEEQTEVNKGIFARIGEILSYINPLSENFFAYKLIDLLIDALKSLFVPEERLFRFLF